MRMQPQNPDRSVDQALRLRPTNPLESAPPAFREAACAQQQDQNQRQQQPAQQNREDDGFKNYSFVRKHR
jgi:hypothetical protein